MLILFCDALGCQTLTVSSTLLQSFVHAIIHSENCFCMDPIMTALHHMSHVTHLSVVRIHDSLAGGANGDGSLHVSISRLSHPCHFSSKALHMILLSFQSLFGHKEREIGILNARLLDAIIKPALDDLPHLVGPGAEYVAPCIVACITSTVALS